MHRASPPPPSQPQPTSPNINEEDSLDCPLCMEEMDPTDRHFKPCPCGYQVCRFCWNRIKQNENERCPACRRIYTDDAVEFTPLSPEELAAINKGKRKKESGTLSHSSNATTPLAPSSPPLNTTRKEFLDDEDGPVLPSRRHLVEVRVTQKNLVYVIGIPIHLADEQILKQEEYFGRFGKILKLVINKRAYVRTTGSGAINNAAAYITYSRDEEALKAIKLVDGRMIEGAKLLRATYGTTKYCAHFLRGKSCPKNGCLYLHHEVFDNEVSTGLVEQQKDHSNPLSTQTSPPPSPSPQAANELESDRVKSFFERLQRWTRIDELLADLSPEAALGVPFVSGASAGTQEPLCTFNPFDEPAPATVIVPPTPLLHHPPPPPPFPSAPSPPQPVLLKPVKVEDIMKEEPTRAEPVEAAANKAVAGEPQAVVLKKTPPKMFSTAQPGRKTLNNSTPEVAAPTVSATDYSTQKSSSASTASVPHQPQQVNFSPKQPAKQLAKKSPVTNVNLFSVLSVEDVSEDIPETNIEEVGEQSEKEPEGIKQEKKPSQSQQQQQAKKTKKDPNKKLEEDLDEMLREVELKSAKSPATTTATNQSITSSQSSSKTAATPSASQSTKKPSSVPLSKQPALSNLLSSLSLNSVQRNGKHEDEASLRIIELEKILKNTALDGKEVEVQLRESIVSFLQSMNVTLDDDYMPKH